MSVLHFSLATSGIPSDRMNKAVWACRMAAALADDAGNVTDHFAVNVRADGRHIEPAATRRHGITTGAANRTGVDEAFALTTICGLRASGKRTQDRPGLISCARILVAWDAEFVTRVITDLFARHGEPSNAWLRPGLQVVSLQQACVPWCKLPPADDDAMGQYRRPTRDEAAFHFWGAQARDLPHSPDSNLMLEQRLYAVLRERKVFEAEGVAA